MKISELVERTKVARETIHYYIREGVLSKPRKKGKNTADYDESYVDQIRIIKGLQDNYYLPLSVIKKVLGKQKKKSVLEQNSFWIQSEYFQPIELLLSDVIEGEELFRKETELDLKWLSKMEEWGVINYQDQSGTRVYSRDDVMIGKLITNMGKTGFGKKHGYNPEELRNIVDFFRSSVDKWLYRYLEPNLETVASDDFTASGGQFTEMMSLLFYHIFRRIVREEFSKFLQGVAEADDETRQTGDQAQKE